MYLSPFIAISTNIISVQSRPLSQPDAALVSDYITAEFPAWPVYGLCSLNDQIATSLL
jgi:hypothetical protein